MCHYIIKCVNQRDADTVNRRLLPWDSLSVTRMVQLEKFCKIIHSSHPLADVSWNKRFQAQVSDEYEKWISSGINQYHKSGHTKAPPRKIILQWILDAPSNLPKELSISIKSLISFKSCALNLSLDGSKDALFQRKLCLFKW